MGTKPLGKATDRVVKDLKETRFGRGTVANFVSAVINLLLP